MKQAKINQWSDPSPLAEAKANEFIVIGLPRRLTCMR